MREETVSTLVAFAREQMRCARHFQRIGSAVLAGMFRNQARIAMNNARTRKALP